MDWWLLQRPIPFPAFIAGSRAHAKEMLEVMIVGRLRLILQDHTRRKLDPVLRRGRGVEFTKLHGIVDLIWDLLRPCVSLVQDPGYSLRDFRDDVLG